MHAAWQERPSWQVFSPRQALAVFAPATIVFLAGIATYVQIQRTRAERVLVIHTDAVIEAVDAVLADLLNAETRQRGYVITGVPEYLLPYRSSSGAVDADIATLRTLTAGNPAEHARVVVLDSLVAARRAELTATIDVRRNLGFGAAAAATNSDRNRHTMDAVRGILGLINTEARNLYVRRVAIEERRARVTEVVLIAGTAIAVVMALFLNGMLTRYATAQATAARKLAAQAAQLQAQAVELEFQARQLQDQATELETQNEELLVTSETLLEQKEAGDAARRLAEQARADAQRANAAKTQFLTAMSHELRTPLNAIGGYVDLLDLEVQGRVTDGQRDYLNRLRKSSHHLLGLINDLLDLGRVEAGHLQLQPADVSIDSILRSVEGMVSPMCQSSEISLVWPADDPGLTTYADAERVKQILINLLTNACKFTEAGGQVIVECGGPPRDNEEQRDAPRQAAAAGAVWVQVSDTGRGIARENLETIFELFVQIDRHLTEASHQGAGLGLPISRTLARGMGGDLTVESTLGQGTVFTLTLPARAPVVAVPLAARTPRTTLVLPSV